MAPDQSTVFQGDDSRFSLSFLDSLSENIAVVDAGGRILAVNEAWREFARRAGLPEEFRVKGEEYVTVARDEGMFLNDSAAEALRSVVDGEAERVEREYSLGGGEERRWFRVEVSCFRDGETTYFTVNHRDITGRRESDRQREKYRVLSEAADAVIVTVDTEGTIRSVNPAVREVFGHEPEDLLGEPLTVLMPEEHREAHREGFREYLETGERKLDWNDIKLPGRHADGSEFPLSVTFSEMEFRSERYFVGHLRDLTEQRSRQSELATTRERFRQLTENLEHVFWIAHADYSKFEYLSPYFEELWGRERDALENLPHDFLGTVHEEDRNRVEEKLEDQKTQPRELEYRIRRPDGEVRWVRDRAFPITDDAGNVTRIAGISEDVTEKKRTQQRLAESEKRFRRMAENINEAFFFIAPDYSEVLYVNPPAEDLYGVPLEDLRNDPEAWERNVPPEDLEKIHRDMEEGKQRVDNECRIRHDGETRWIRARIYPIFDEEGAVEKLAGIATDITEQKQAQRKNREKAEFLDAINDRMPGVAYQFHVSPEGEYSFPYLSEGFHDLAGVSSEEAVEDFDSVVERVHPGDLEPLLESIEVAVEQRSPWQHEVRFRHPEEGEKWVMGSSRPEERKDGSLVFSGVLIDITERKRLEENLEEETTRQELAQEIASLGHWSISVPEWEVDWSGETYRIFGLDSEDDDLPLDEAFDYYHPDDREECRALVEQAAENGTEVSFEARIETPAGEVRHIDVLGEPRRGASGEVEELFGVVQDVTDFKGTERALRESERRFRQMAENIESVFWLSDLDKNMLYVSPAFEDVFGIPAEDLYRDSEVFFERIHPEDREQVREAMFQDQLSGDYDVEFRIIRPDGETRWIHDRAFPVEGKEIDEPRMAGIAEDVTERKRREQDLTLKNRTIEEAPIGISLIDPDWQDKPIVYVNEAFTELTGYAEEELLGNSHRILEEEENDPEAFTKMQEAIENGESCSLEVVDYRRDGSTFWNQVTLAPVRDEEGSITHYVRFNQDVSERKETQRELRETEERFRQLTENIDEVFWISDTDTDEMIYVSPTYERVWGRSVESLYENPRSFLEGVHPEDREEVESALPDQKHGDYDMKYRIRQPDGEVRWVRDRAFPVTNEEGEVHRVVGIAEDVTEMKELQREREKFVEIVEHSRSCIIRANLDREITYVNPAGLEMLGVDDLGEVQGEPLRSIHPEEDHPKYEEVVSTVNREGQWHGERQFLNRSTGEVVEVLFDGFQIRDPETDEPLEYASVATDISDQIEIEEQLRSMVQEKETLLQEVHHRVKNNLQVVLGLLGLQARQLDSEEARGALRSSERRIQSMAMIHEKLYEGAQLSSIDFGDYVDDLLEKIVESFYENTEEVELRTEVEPSNLDPDTIISCGLILNELVSNSLQHGFGEEFRPRVEVEFFTDAELDHHLVVSDNGRGVEPENLDETESLGMRLVRNLARNQLHGEINYSRSQGLEVEVVFPPAAARHEKKES